MAKSQKSEIQPLGGVCLDRKDGAIDRDSKWYPQLRRRNALCFGTTSREPKLAREFPPKENKMVDANLLKKNCEIYFFFFFKRLNLSFKVCSTIFTIFLLSSSTLN